MHNDESVAVQAREIGPKRVLLAWPQGYCAGVERAVETVERALALHGAPVYVRKEIVHNRTVVADLRSRGVVFVEDTDEVPAGELLVYSAHGVSPAVRAASQARGLRTIDATCPLVTKVHQEVRHFARNGYDILMIGHADHEEVEGTAGEAPDAVHIIDGPESIDQVRVRDEERVVWLSQTTLSVDETTAIVELLRRRFPLLRDPPSDDICYATQNRQAALKAMAPECELVIVVGSRNSSNSVRLVEVALAAGVPNAYLVDNADEMNADWLTGVRTVGLSAGASVPTSLVVPLVHRLGELGFEHVHEVNVADENLVFALPRDLGYREWSSGLVPPRARYVGARSRRFDEL